MKNWKDLLSDKTIFYITPDVKRGIGLEGILSNYHIICSYVDSLIPILRNQGANIFCLSEKIDNVLSFNNSGKLLEHPFVFDYIKKNSTDTPHIIVFKPSLKIDLICRRMGYRLLVNNRELNDKFEDKINFWQMTQKYFSEYSIPAVTGILSKLSFTDLKNQLGLPMVIQFSHGWAGKTTFFIESEIEFNSLVKDYPYTKVKVTKYIEGFTVLNNACIYKDQILVSPPAIQISNIEKLKEKRGVTCGRQWPVKFITEKEISIIEKITQQVGSLMSKSGFKGFFGLDFFIGKGNKIYLSENNARFTASCSFYTKLELGRERTPLFAYHLAAFLGKELLVSSNHLENSSGSQIILRNPKAQPKIENNVKYGVFQTDNNSYVYQRNDYYPQFLGDNEFILMRRQIQQKSPEDREISRIESKREVLENVRNFKSWVKKILE